MAEGHYENFPVASIVLPAKYRWAVAVIYRFARSADDFADEGTADAMQRLASLDDYRAQLATIESGNPAASPLFGELAEVIRRYRLPIELFYDLLDAFSQDVVRTRYETYPELLDYCRRSANPVGRLLLHIFSATTPDNLAQSDAICTSLQLINFWQDVAFDWQKGRIYLPLEDMKRFQVAESHLHGARSDAAWAALMRFECERTRSLMLAGATLPNHLPGRTGLELALVVQGGLRILERIDAVCGDVFRHRPKLAWHDWPLVLFRALRRPRA